MAMYFELAVIENKEVYGLGTVSEAKNILPLYAELFNDKTVCIWGDQDCSWCEDRYPSNYENTDYGEPWGCEYFYKHNHPDFKSKPQTKDILPDDFWKLFDKIKGKETKGLWDKIKHYY